MRTEEDRSVIRMLCGAVLQLGVENGVLRSLVVDMAAGIPRGMLDVDERRMLDSLVNR